MFPGISLFPEQASTLAADVDNLYCFIVAVTAFFAIVVTIVVIFFAVKYRTDDPLAVGARIDGSIPLELAWSIIPFLISHRHLRLGASVFFDLVRPPDQTLEIYATGKRWMWKFQHLDGQNEINELHVPAGPPGQGHLHVRGRAALAVLPGIPSQGGRDSRPLQQRLVHGDEARAVPSLLRGVLRHQAFRHGRQRGRDGAGGVSGVAERQRGSRLAGHARRAALQRSRLQYLPSAATEAGAGRRWPTSSARPSSSRTAGAVTVDEAYVRESILTPQAKLVAGYQPLMPTFQGLVSEENVMALVEYVKSLRASSGAGSRAEAATRRAAPQENK